MALHFNLARAPELTWDFMPSGRTGGEPVLLIGDPKGLRRTALERLAREVLLRDGEVCWLYPMRLREPVADYSGRSAQWAPEAPFDPLELDPRCAHGWLAGMLRLTLRSDRDLLRRAIERADDLRPFEHAGEWVTAVERFAAELGDPQGWPWERLAHWVASGSDLDPSSPLESLTTCAVNETDLQAHETSVLSLVGRFLSEAYRARSPRLLVIEDLLPLLSAPALQSVTTMTLRVEEAKKARVLFGLSTGSSISEPYLYSRLTHRQQVVLTREVGPDTFREIAPGQELPGDREPAYWVVAPENEAPYWRGLLEPHVPVFRSQEG